MNENVPLYNSRIIKIFIEFLTKNYPDLDIDSILSYAGINRYEVEDPGQWFSQKQTDCFHEIVVKTTGNPNIAREAGRYTASTEGLGAAKQRVLGFVGPTPVYLLMEKIYPILSRGATLKAQKLRSGKIEIISTPNNGVNEKPYQCENRLGSLEAMAKLFTDQFASISHPTCYHKGEGCCRYLITWKKNPFIIWKQIRNYILIASLLLSFILFFALSPKNWAFSVLVLSLINLIYSLYSELLEKKELTKTIKTQGDAAKDLLDEMNIRHNNALLMQEIGQATSSILDIGKLLEVVTETVKVRLNFDRGLIMLANSEKTRLLYKAGYGYTEEQENLLKQTEFHLDNPESKGFFVVSFKKQKPFLINSIDEDSKNLSLRSLVLAQKMGVQSLICVPIVYEKESLGILTVDNIKSKRPHTKSDINLLMGVASQTAVSIVNAMSFQKLQASERKYRDLVENANSIIMRREPSGKITFFNEFAQKFFGFAEDEIIGKNIAGTILPDNNYTRQTFERLVKSLEKDPEKQITDEKKNILRSGETAWIAWTYKPIFDNNGTLIEILCIGNDITELKRTEEEKRDLEARLQRAQKMEAIGTLAGGVAHDLNNILSGLVSYPELLLMDLPEESPLKKPILTIQKSGEKAASIVQDLLTLARRGVSSTDVVNLNDIISEYLLSPEHEKLKIYHPDIQVLTQLDKTLLNIIGSKVHLSKTVMNLVYNAAEAMPEGGKILLQTTNQYIDEPLKEFDEIPQGDYVTLTISDSGIGIPEKDLERIFEPFYTKKVMGKSGTGLGLAVIWGTVKDHNGFIDVESLEGKGSTFKLYFPITNKEMLFELDTSFEELLGKGESILVVDDVEEQRVIASEMLTKLGYSVKTVSSGEEAFDFLQNHSADLLVLDMIMTPGMDGLETYKKVVEFHPGQKTVIVSGFSESDRVKKLQKLGAGNYVKKPYSIQGLGQAIRDELSK